MVSRHNEGAPGDTQKQPREVYVLADHSCRAALGRWWSHGLRSKEGLSTCHCPCVDTSLWMRGDQLTEQRVLVTRVHRRTVRIGPGAFWAWAVSSRPTFVL